MLTLNNGETHKFRIIGGKLIETGFGETHLKGDVFNLDSVEDLLETMQSDGKIKSIRTAIGTFFRTIGLNNLDAKEANASQEVDPKETPPVEMIPTDDERRTLLIESVSTAQ